MRAPGRRSGKVEPGSDLGAAIVACVSLDEPDREEQLAFLGDRLRVSDVRRLLG